MGAAGLAAVASMVVAVRPQSMQPFENLFDGEVPVVCSGPPQEVTTKIFFAGSVCGPMARSVNTSDPSGYGCAKIGILTSCQSVDFTSWLTSSADTAKSHDHITPLCHRL